jgi:hypothetical protein
MHLLVKAPGENSLPYSGNLDSNLWGRTSAGFPHSKFLPLAIFHREAAKTAGGESPVYRGSARFSI